MNWQIARRARSQCDAGQRLARQPSRKSDYPDYALRSSKMAHVDAARRVDQDFPRRTFAWTEIPVGAWASPEVGL